MKKFNLSAVALAVSAGSALAADLPSRKAPILPPPPPMWTGFYAGLNAGYNFGTNSNVGVQNVAAPWTAFQAGTIAPNNFVAGAPIVSGIAAVSMDGWASNTQSGFIGGAQVGYNYQYGSNIVIGLEADIQGAGIRGASRTGGASAGSFAVGNFNEGSQPGSLNNAVGSSVVQGGVDWLGTVRGRVGYLWTPTLLVYGTGGFAYGGAWANVAQSATESVSLSTNILAPTSLNTLYLQTNSWIGGGRQSQILTGWTAGGGVEWMFMPNWSLKAEALYWDLGRMNVQTVAYGIPGLSSVVNNNIANGRTSMSYQGVTAKAGVNYHFNWGAAPVVASY